MRSLFISLVILFAFALPASAADVDLSISAGDIFFSKETLVAGDRVRLYAVIRNSGEEDVSGYVSFFQGSLPIGDSQIISVRAGGTPEEVYVDFVIPSTSFNIRAEIRGTDPADEQTSNNLAITKLYAPVLDDDRDGIANDVDNCLTTKNSSQTDSDTDKTGDACDTDDDNDGLSDDVEREIGTDPLRQDTDGDGVNDPIDAYPLDPTKTKEPPPAPVVVPAPVKPVVPTPSTPAPSATREVEEPSTAPSSEQTPDGEPTPLPETEGGAEKDLAYAGQISPGAVFSYTRTSWNTFHFEVLAPLREGERLEWNFGDGSTSGLRSADHTYRVSGSYVVSVRRVTVDGVISEDRAEIDVPFFTLQNRLVLAVVGVLLLALLAGSLAAFRLRSSRSTSQKQDADI